MNPNAAEIARVAPGRILVVDDQEAIRHAHARLIGRAGHEVFEAASVRDALALFDEEHFDAVLSDVQMPDANGIELLVALKNRDPDVSVVLVSGNPDLPTALKAVEHGALEYLTKPIELDKLHASVERAITTTREKRTFKQEAERLRSGERLRPDLDHPASRSGQLVGGRYRLGRKIGEGGMGAVYEATREDLAGMPVAVKIVHPDLGAEPGLLKRFRREAEIVAAIDHPNVVRIVDFQAPEGSPAILVMELLHGAPLSAVLAREGPFQPARAVAIAEQILSGLAVAHEKHIVHRDLKPENVFLTNVTAVGEVVRLLDFGIAKSTESDDSLRLTRTGAVLGTPAYMAPEQARGQAFDRRGDLYAVGCILYEMLAGRPPFHGDNYNALLMAILEGRPTPLRALRPDVPSELRSIVTKAMHRLPRSRYQTAAEMSRDLARWSMSPDSSYASIPASLGNAPTMRLDSTKPSPSTKAPSARPLASRREPRQSTKPSLGARRKKG